MRQAQETALARNPERNRDKHRHCPQGTAGSLRQVCRRRSSRSAAIIGLNAPRARRAFELLAAPPLSLIGLTPTERDAVVVTAVADEHGAEHLVSRFGDDAWDLAPEFEAKNRKDATQKIAWPTDVPRARVDDAKAALYCALRRGRHGRPWSGSAVTNCGQRAAQTLRYLAGLRLGDFGQVRALMEKMELSSNSELTYYAVKHKLIS